MEKNKKTTEEKLLEIEDLLSKIEDSDIGLEESFALYEKGMKLIKEVSVDIDKVEKKLQILERTDRK